MKVSYLILILCWLSASSSAFEVLPDKELKRLLKEVDVDHDEKITVDDAKRSPLKFKVETVDGKDIMLEGVYPLSNLLQELKLGEDTKKKEISIPLERIYENPVDRISRSIKEMYWDGLTRQIDSKSLDQVLTDSKIPHGEYRYLYVPSSDPEGLKFYQQMAKDRPDLKMKVIKLPEKFSREFVNSLSNKHGLLSLGLKRKNGKLTPIPYVVPGGRFNELYGWDSYFHILGLLQSNRVGLAQDIVDNFLYEVRHYGKILNANRTYYLTRSQPPFLTSMIRAVYERLPKNPESKRWLKEATEVAFIEYQNIWMGKERLTNLGLSRYAGFAEGVPPEVEKGHFDSVLMPFAQKYNLSIEKFISKYDAGEIKEERLNEFFQHDRAVRESGHDTTYRWRVGKEDRCADFVTVDLNSLLYKYELDFAYLTKFELGDKLQNYSSKDFLKISQKRKELIRKLFWNNKKKIFFDYNWKNKFQGDYLSATSLYPLWAYEPAFPESKILDQKEALDLVQSVLKELETHGGITATSLASLKKHGDRDHARQWEYPNGWAPHQMLVWQGLINYGFKSEAQRLIYKWLYLITRNAMDYNGTIPEKYDVVGMSHQVFAEYGNVGTKFSYITKEGFGWMNASYLEGIRLLDPKRLTQLHRLMTPSELKNK